MSKLDYLIEQDVEHGTFSAKNIFNDDYITPMFYSYAKSLEKTVERIQWHDIKEDPTDLPKHCNVILLAYHQYIDYADAYFDFELGNYNGYTLVPYKTNRLDKPIAWREIMGV